MKKYMLSEAFDKRLLVDDDDVDLTLLYLPLKRIFRRGLRRLNALDIRCFAEGGKWHDSNTHPLKGEIYRKDGKIFTRIQIYPLTSLSDADLDFVAQNLLTDNDFNLIAHYEKGSNGVMRFIIQMADEITVGFDEEDDFPILELPVHTQYTV